MKQKAPNELQKIIQEQSARLSQLERELEIEAALERVRAASMAMHTSEELVEVATILYRELRGLDSSKFSESNIVIIDQEKKQQTIWGARTDTAYLEKITIPLLGDQVLQRIYDAWKKQESFHAIEINGSELQNHLDFVHPKENRTELEDSVFTNMPDPSFFQLAFFSHGYLELLTDRELNEDLITILIRFAKVFDQCYTRFLDLQKAEAQAQESQIEAALERVRSKAMAMHSSEDLTITVDTFFSELNALNVLPRRCGVGIVNKETRLVDIHVTTATEDNAVKKMTGNLTLKGHPVLEAIYYHWIDQKEYHPVLRGKEILAYYKAMNPEVVFPDFADDVTQYGYYFFFKEGGVFAWTDKEFFESELQIFRRYTSVLSLTYRRYIDIKEAEAQAREAQIEAALERVRAASMAMHHSEELVNVATIVYQQLLSLGFDQVVSGGFLLPIQEEGIQKCWFSETASDLLEVFNLPYSGDPILDERIKYWKDKTPFLQQTLKPKRLKKHMDFLFPKNSRDQEVQQAIDAMPPLTVFNMAFFKHGYINLISNEELSMDQQSILIRFAQVFEQTYTRFQDLQRAEEQSREAQIEAALERVRATSMAMHKTEEISDVVVVLFKELKDLNLDFIASWIYVFRLEEGFYDMWLSPIEEYNDLPFYTKFPSALFEETSLNSWKEGKEFTSLSFANKEAVNKVFVRFDAATNTEYFTGFQEMFQLERMELISAPYSYGNIGILTVDPASKEYKEILKRFTKVFEQCYTRFLDLQKAEAQAREAQIEAALERVRAASMAMHSSTELSSVSETLFQQVKELNLTTDHTRIIINILDDQNGDIEFWMTSTGGGEINNTFKFNANENEIYEAEFKAFQAIEKDRRKEFKTTNIYKGDNFDDWLDWLLAVDIITTKDIKDVREAGIQQWFEYSAFFSHGQLTLSGESQLADEGLIILQRFAVVFEQTFTRFLDLQKAEAQAREAQIEAALERVRASAMAMHTSDGLIEVSYVLRQQMALLDDKDLESIVIHLYDENRDEIHALFSYRNPEDTGGEIYPGQVKIGWSDTERMVRDKKMYLSSESDYTIAADRELLKDWYNWLAENVPAVIDYDDKGNILIPDILYYNYSKFKGGSLLLVTGDEATVESKNLLKRSAKVFDMAYTRFLDLQKAEAQAREALIELSLERIRAHALAMRESADLQDIVVTMRNEFVALGHEAHYFWHMRWRQDIYEKAMTSGDGTRIGSVMELPRHIHGNIKLIDEWEKSDDPTVIYAMDAETALDYLDKMITLGDFKQVDHNAISPDDIRHIGGLTFIMARTTYGEIGYSLPGAQPKVPSDDLATLVRFAGVFDLAYQRFEDLRIAEAQAREVEIELALEKIRSRSLVMHKSDELNEVVAIIFEKLKELQIPATAVGIAISIDGSKDLNGFVCGENKAGLVITNYRLPYFNNKISKDLNNAIEKRLDYFVGNYSKEEKNSFYEYLVEHTAEFKNLPEDIKRMIFESPTYTISMVAVKNAMFNINDFEGKTLSENAVDIIKRFAKVFEQAYTRFLDLQKAEAQAREAQIEASLERVRAASMAMHKTNELANVVVVLFKQFAELYLEFYQVWINIFLLEEGISNCWFSPVKGVISEPYTAVVPLGPFEESSIKSWRAGEEFSYLSWKGLEEVDKITRELTEMTGHSSFVEIQAKKRMDRMEIVDCNHKYGVMAMAKNDDITDNDRFILRRFTKVFEQVYTRFLDLQKAEAQAREAQIETALEKVRSRTMAMQHSDELPEAANSLFLQVQGLGIPAWSAGYCIWENEEKTYATAFMSSEGVLQKPFSLPTKGVGYNFYNPVQKGELFHIEELGGEEIIKHYAFMRTLPIFGEVIDGIIEAGFPLPTFQIFHVLYFPQGYLMFITYERVPDVHDIFQRFTKVFEQTYTRFLDLQTKEQQAMKIREEKERLEKTLNDLQVTQTQLIQAEKMASLGELTAGIAHEIQNPLNFVNNFSEINSELIDELTEELENGEYEEVKSIAQDIKENEQKITHHGKRADAIVKGMLQHSRTSTGIKEPTDINALCDEYLRLSYHGLRAKDKSFNADFKTDFDAKLPLVNVIAQDIGRVLLNLINNAFYAVNEKSKTIKDVYAPKVTIVTQLINNTVEIIVIDNGLGIPSDIKEKIIQPFFTTKPTGQGTGLGLSLSYDIVKAHGGELLIESVVGNGSKFMIKLPLNKS